MRLTQNLQQKPAVSPQLVVANELLALSTPELEQAIAEELAENPALEVELVERCSHCGTKMVAGYCPTCREEQGGDLSPGREESFASEGYGGSGSTGDWSDTVSGLPSGVSLTEHLLAQARLSLPAEDLPIVRFVVGNLDDRGWLSCDLPEIASDLRVSLGRVQRVVAGIQSLEPAGIAARDARECLLIQIADLRSSGSERRLAEQLIRDHWRSLGRSSPVSLGRQVDASSDDVRRALRFIRENLNPFPGHAFWTDARGASSDEPRQCPEPDVIIRETATSSQDYEIELPKAGRFGLRVSASYRRAMERLGNAQGRSSAQGWELWQELCGRARLFARSVEQRWETLYDLMTCLVDYQRDFLRSGREALRPLTQAQVAEMMGVHESTVSRAVAGKFAELPNGKVVSLQAFFDSAAPVRHRIEQLIAEEEEPLSDRAIAQLLSDEGYDVARRTVAKYRNALNILPSSMRRWCKDLQPQGIDSPTA